MNNYYRATICLLFSLPVLVHPIVTHSGERSRSVPAAMKNVVIASPPGENPQGDSEVEARILSISVFGNIKTDKDLILKVFGLHEGEGFSVERVEGGLKRIERFSGIESASFRKMSNPGEEGIRLFIIVTEAETRFVQPLVERSITNKVAFGLSLSETNLRGKDEKIHASGLFGGATVLKCGWSKPFFIDAPFLGVGASLEYRDYSYPYPDFKNRLIDDRIKRLRGALSFRFKAYDVVALSISPGFDWIDVADSMLIDQGKDDVPDAPSGGFTTLEVGVEFDMLDREFYPTTGVSAAVARKDWGLLQDEAGIKNFLYRMKGELFFKLGRALCSMHSRGIFTHGRVPITMLQHIGGERSIRGYDYGVFSGENCIVGNAEIRFPINFTDISDHGNPFVLVDFNIFADCGTCWSRPDNVDLESLHSGFGCGLNIMPMKRMLLKVGYAWRKETSGTWYFDAGTRF